MSPSLAQWLETTSAVLTHYGVGGLVITAFTEASFFPLPPDIILIPLCLLKPHLSFWYALVATISSSLGGVFGTFIGLRFGRPLLSRFASPQRIGQVEQLFRRYGGWAVALAALTPIPYKVFTIAAGVFRVSPLVVLSASLGGRGLRFFLEALAVYLWGEEATALLNNYLGPVTLALGALLVLAAAVYARRPARMPRILFWKSRRTLSPLAPLGEPGLYLFAGACLSFVFLILFAELAEEVAEQEFLHADLYLLELAASARGPFLTQLMRVLTAFGSFAALIPLAALSILLLERQGARCEAVFLAISLAGGWSIDEFLKWGFHRARPNIARLIDVSGYSFPSGHTMVATAFYGMLAYLLARRLPSGRRRFVVLGAALLILGTGISRIYLGAHYPTDVLGGFLAGALWLTCSVMAHLVVSNNKGGSAP